MVGRSCPSIAAERIAAIGFINAGNALWYPYGIPSGPGARRVFVRASRRSSSSSFTSKSGAVASVAGAAARNTLCQSSEVTRGEKSTPGTSPSKWSAIRSSVPATPCFLSGMGKPAVTLGGLARSWNQAVGPSPSSRLFTFCFLSSSAALCRACAESRDSALAALALSASLSPSLAPKSFSVWRRTSRSSSCKMD